jgi:hypothetical protein
MTKLEKPLRMTAASSVSHSGRLWNVTGEFSENEFYFVKDGNDPYAINLSLEPSKQTMRALRKEDEQIEVSFTTFALEDEKLCRINRR